MDREERYWLENGMTEYPRCEYCGESLTSKNFIKNGKAGYRKYCGIKCCKKDQDYDIIIQKRKETNIERYGSNNPWYFENFRIYIKDKYGVDMIRSKNDV